MAEQHNVEKEVALESVITTVVQIPGVKVNRRKFLSETLQICNDFRFCLKFYYILWYHHSCKIFLFGGIIYEVSVLWIFRK